MTRKEAGAKGGRATLERYGVEHYRELGRRGFAGLARSLGYGGRHLALARLTAKGRIRPFTPDLTPEELAALYEAVGL